MSSNEAPEGCYLTAHDTGDGWSLEVRDYHGNLLGYLAWPESWPEVLSAAELREKGFGIV